MIRKKSLLLLLVFTLIASMLLAACAPKEPAVTDGGGGEETPAPETPVVYPGSERGNVLTFGETAPGGIFNPIYYSTAYDEYIIGLVFDPMFNINKDGSLTTQGGLVEDYDVSEDGSVYTFKLREGIKFHDGEELTADDLIYTYDAIMRSDYQGRLFTYVRNIVGAVERQNGETELAEGLKKLDEYTVEVTLIEGKANSLYDLNRYIIPQHYYDKSTYEESAALNRDPVGTGPFTLTEYNVDQYVSLAANPDYWDGAPKLDGIIYKVVSRDNIISEFEIGSVDVINFENSIENYELIDAIDHGTLLNNWNNGYAYAAFNFTNPLFQDVKVRQALVYGVNRHGFVESFFGESGGAIANGPISPVSWAYPQDQSVINEYRYDPAKANELLDEAGWEMGSDGFRYKDGQKLAFKWTTYSDAAWSVQFTALAKENWKEIGVDCEIVLMDFNSLVTLTSDPANKDQWDMLNMAWSLTPDPDMQTTFSKNNFAPGNNKGFYVNEEIEALMQEGILEFDLEKRKEIYQDLAVKFNEDLPYIFVYIRMNPFFINKRVSNLEPSEFVKWFQDAHLIELQ